PVIPNEYILTLRTVSQTENFFCMQFVYEHTGSVEYTQQLFNACRLVCAVVAQNGGMLPDHRKKDGVDKEAFIHKFNIVCRMATVILADIAIQFDWFNERVAKLFSFEKLKN